jgi:hypothetical protein
MWNTASSNGEVQQCVDATGLHTTISLNEIQYQAQGAPAGSPEIGYGIDSYDVPFGPLSTKTTLSTFPMPVSSFDNLNYWISVGYSLGTPTPTGLTIDLTYDLWIEAAPSLYSPPKSDDLEIMLFLYGSHAPPDGISICPASQSSCFSQTNPNGQSTLWNIYEGIGGAGTTTITFLLTSPTPTSTGSIAVQLQDFIEKALSIHPVSASPVLMGIELGTEFGGTPPAQPSASWSWTLSSLVLQNSCDTLELLPSGSESVCSPVTVTFHTNPSAEGSIQWDSCSGTSYTDEQTLPVPTGTYSACYVPSGYTFDNWTCSGGLSCAESTDPTDVTVSGSGSITLNLKIGSLSNPVSTSLTASTSYHPSPRTFTVSGTLTANGVGIGSENIVLVFGWSRSIVTVTTNSTGSIGSYTYTATAPASAGSYNVDAFFLGDYTNSIYPQQYLPSKATTTITIT